MSKGRDRIVYRHEDGQWANKRNNAIKQVQNSGDASEIQE